MIRQSILPFKLEISKDLITFQAELGLLGEFAVGLGLNKALDEYLPGPGSGAGYLWKWQSKIDRFKREMAVQN